MDPVLNNSVSEYTMIKASLTIMFKASSHFEKRQFTRAEGGHTPHIKSSTPNRFTAFMNIPRVNDYD
jgi:hypothetical protein